MRRAWVALFTAALLLTGMGNSGWAQTSQSVGNSGAFKIKGCTAKGHISFFH